MTAVHSFKSFDDVVRIVELVLAQFPALKDVELGLTELMLNAVEHGNLEISYEGKGRMVENGTIMDEVTARLAMPAYKDRHARLEITETPADVTIQVIDEGPGFDWRRYLQRNLRDIVGYHGRGILLSDALFTSLTYEGKGNHAIAVIRKASG